MLYCTAKAEWVVAASRTAASKARVFMLHIVMHLAINPIVDGFASQFERSKKSRTGGSLASEAVLTAPFFPRQPAMPVR